MAIHYVFTRRREEGLERADMSGSWRISEEAVFGGTVGSYERKQRMRILHITIRPSTTSQHPVSVTTSVHRMRKVAGSRGWNSSFHEDMH